MTHYYISETYIQASQRLDSACNWLDSIGIDYSRTRVGRYKNIFSSLARHQASGNIDNFFQEHTFASWVNAAHEVAELVRIYDGLHAQSNPTFLTRLSDAIKGQELYVLDSANRSGRDFSFELAIAAKFVKAGYIVDFGHDADIKIDAGGFEFFVECKRLKSENKIQARIKEGLKQLHKRYAKSQNPLTSKGMLAISIGKTINENLGLLEGSDENDLGINAFLHNQRFIERHRQTWQNQKDHRTLGVAVVLDTPGMLTKERQLITCHEVTANNCIDGNDPMYQDFIEIVSRVFPRRA